VRSSPRDGPPMTRRGKKAQRKPCPILRFRCEALSLMEESSALLRYEEASLGNCGGGNLRGVDDELREVRERKKSLVEREESLL